VVGYRERLPNWYSALLLANVCACVTGFQHSALYRFRRFAGYRMLQAYREIKKANINVKTTAKIHRFVKVVMYCIVTTCSAECCWHCSDETVHHKSDKMVNFIVMARHIVSYRISRY